MGINFSKVAFTYYPNKKIKKNQYVLENCNLSINNKSEFIAIVGHTGSGKSTLVQLMNALILPTLGEVKVDENIISNKKHNNLKEIRQKIGLVFQFPEYQLFEETILKDVSFGPKNFGLSDPEERAKKALDIFKISKEYYEKNPYRLSGGEMRKVAISGILASDPEILILDEPTVGLDPLTKKELIELLKKINYEQGKTIIIVTHDMDVLWNVATRVILIDDKTIIYDGSKVDLFKNEDFIKKHSLDLPEVVKIMKHLNEKLSLNMNIYQDNIENAYLEIMRHIHE